jgi:hypothetical protein
MPHDAEGARMTTPSTADSQDAGMPVRPVVERGAAGPGGTHSAVKGQPAPRLPHERDESSDSGTREPSELMKKAAQDVERGQADPPRGPQTQEHYSHLTQESRPPSEAGRSDTPPGDSS